MIDSDALLVRALDALPFDASEVHIESRSPRSARFGELQSKLHPKVAGRAAELGYERFYLHQAQAIDLALAGNDVVVTTGTNSGKSLCYTLPTLQSLMSEPSCRAFFLYPTKALAQDQAQKLRQWVEPLGLRAATYDGDTPKRQRPTIRKLAHIVATNVDMLHVGIAPNHENWIPALKSLRWIVLDEAHVYRGVFGAHTAWTLRRLLRLCEFYGSRPQIIACSGTVGNPAELVAQLTGRKPVVVDEDGSPSGPRSFFFVNPKLGDDGKEPSRNMLVARSLAGWTAEGIRSMAFCRSRTGVELVLKYAREALDRTPKGDPAQIQSYRAGYLADDRRSIEKDFFRGDVIGLATTNAMELGVDVGGLDATLQNGYPGSVASFWQQAGRAGRGEHASVVALVANADQLDQFLVSNPNQLMGAESERVIVHPVNETVTSAQLLCMAHERPIAPTEFDALWPEALTVAETLDGSGALEFRAGRFYYPAFEAPASKISLRGLGGTIVELRKGAETIGTMERWRAMQYAHEGAIYIHRGETFQVESLDLEAGIALLEATNANFYTESIVRTTIEPYGAIRSCELIGSLAELCSVRVTTEVASYVVRSIESGAILGTHELLFEPTSFDTLAVRWTLPPVPMEGDVAEFLCGVHGVEHALTATAPHFAACDRGDLGSSWTMATLDTGRPAVFVYDVAPGGMGLCEALFDRVGEHWTLSGQRLKQCACDAGCPRCLYAPRCEVSNASLSKRAAIALFGLD